MKVIARKAGLGALPTLSGIVAFEKAARAGKTASVSFRDENAMFDECQQRGSGRERLGLAVLVQ